MQVRQLFREATIKLLDKHRGALFEFSEILIAPPILQESIAIVFRALVIKAMPDLVANC